MIHNWYEIGYARAMQVEANPIISNTMYPRRDIYSAEDERQYIQGFNARRNDAIKERFGSAD